MIDTVVERGDDPAWDQLRTLIGSDERVRVVVSSVDAPFVADPADLVLTESDLAFTESELSVISALLPAGAPTGRSTVLTAMKGAPYLIREHFERLHRREFERVWAVPLAEPAVRVLDAVIAQLTRPRDERPAIIDALIQGSTLRRFSPDLLDPVRDLEPSFQQAQFARIAALPVGYADILDETNTSDFVWSEGAWRHLQSRLDEVSRQRQNERAASRLERAGRRVPQLFHLLEANRLDAAEHLVRAEMRRFLLFIDGPTTDDLLDYPDRDFVDFPWLSLLATEVRARRGQDAARARREAQHALARLRVMTPDSAESAVAVACASAYAAAEVGDRVAARRSLEHVAEYLDDDESGPLRIAPRGAPDRRHLAGDLYLAFWAAIKTDQIEFSIRCIDRSVAVQSPHDRIAQFDQMTQIIMADFAGARSLDPSGTFPTDDDLLASGAAGFLLIEEGEDAAAVDNLRPLIRRFATDSRTRSAADPFLLTIDGLTGGRLSSAADIDRAIERSRQHWSDGIPSTFLALGATAAYLAHGNPGRADELLSVYVQDDAFSAVAKATLALATDKAASAAAHAMFATGSPFPRLDVVARILNAVSVARLGHAEVARSLLEVIWGMYPAPRLLRFAMRFVSDDDLAALVDCSRTLDPALTEALEACAVDARSLRMPQRSRLTPSEREILSLVCQGLSNEAIAHARFVTTNTIRSQLRRLYKKLGVSSRADAVRVAEQRGFHVTGRGTDVGVG